MGKAVLFGALLLSWLTTLSSRASAVGPASVTGTGAEDEALKQLVGALEKEGLRLDLERKAVVVPAAIQVRRDLLEYLLVSSRGQTHESLLATEVRPSVLNAALLALGVVPGTNVRWTGDAAASNETPGDRTADRQGLEILPPEGDGFFVYVAWRDGDEIHFYRAEDLISNLATGRSLRRHRFVYLGSRFASLVEGRPEVFLAETEGNLINLTFFFSGSTLLTTAAPECVEQTIWAPNFWLLPPRDAPVALVLSRDVLASWPASWDLSLPDVAPAWEAADAALDDAR